MNPKQEISSPLGGWGHRAPGFAGADGAGFQPCAAIGRVQEQR